MTAEEIAKRREVARIKHALKNSVIKSENLETEPIAPVDAEESKLKAAEVTQNENDIMFIAFGRIYSGTIKRGQEVYVLGPKHDPSKIKDKVCFVKFTILLVTLLNNIHYQH